MQELESAIDVISRDKFLGRNSNFGVCAVLFVSGFNELDGDLACKSASKIRTITQVNWFAMGMEGLHQVIDQLSGFGARVTLS